jgi:hypothetical protein
MKTINEILYENKRSRYVFRFVLFVACFGWNFNSGGYMAAAAAAVALGYMATAAAAAVHVRNRHEN